MNEKAPEPDILLRLAQGLPENRPEFTRQPPVQKIKFNPRFYPKEWADKIDVEIAIELKALMGKYRQSKSKPSGRETQAVRESIRKKHHANWLQQMLRYEIWHLSEKILHPLRTKGLCPRPDDATRQERIAAFIKNLDLSQFPEVNPNSNLYLVWQESMDEDEADNLFAGSVINPKRIDYSGPNGYFEQTQPGLIQDYGYPFYTSVTKTQYADNVVKAHQEKITGINTDFFAACLGGDKRLGHDVVFYLLEERFYYFDPAIDCYVPTTEGKLRLWLSQTIQQQAWGQPVEIGQMILNRFRTTSVFDEIINKTKALLAAADGFFHGAQARKRITVDQNRAKGVLLIARSFVEKYVVVDEEGIITISECLAEMESYCRKNGNVLPSPKEIKKYVQEVMRDIYQKGMRNDLVLPDKRCVTGWNGFRLRGNSAIPELGAVETCKIRESGESELCVEALDRETMNKETLTYR